MNLRLRALGDRNSIAPSASTNALIVAAVLMGLTVITAVVVLNPGRETATGAQPGGPAGDPAPSLPTFLDAPIHAESLKQPSCVTRSRDDQVGEQEWFKPTRSLEHRGGQSTGFGSRSPRLVPTPSPFLRDRRRRPRSESRNPT